MFNSIKISFIIAKILKIMKFKLFLFVIFFSIFFINFLFNNFDLFSKIKSFDNGILKFNKNKNIDIDYLKTLNLLAPLNDIFESSEEQKLFDKNVLIKTLSFMIQETDEYDPKLIQFVRSLISFPPSFNRLNLVKKNRTDFSQIGQSKQIDRMLNSRKNGFYVEVGGFDGESHSVNSFNFILIKQFKINFLLKE